MKIRLELTPTEIKKALSLGLKVYPNRGAEGGRVYLNSASEGLTIIQKIAGK